MRTYQKWALTKLKTKFNQNLLKKNAGLLYACIGLTCEVGEIADAVKKHIFYGLPLDKENLKEEIGDVVYLLVALCIYLNIDATEVLKKNMDKINRRYPNGFSNKDAITKRDKKNKKGGKNG